MRLSTCIVVILLIIYASISNTSHVGIENDVVNACHNSYWNLEPLRNDEVDYESNSFSYMALKWVVVFNFCRNTVRTCMWNHFPAFLNSPKKGLRCMLTLIPGDWDDAEYSLEYENGIKVARIAWKSKVKGGFEMWIKCNPNTDYQFVKFNVKSSPWKMYLESKCIC